MASGVGSAVGGALRGAADVPVLGGVLQGLGEAYGQTVTPTLGLIEKSAGSRVAQRAFDENYKTLGGETPSPFDVFATTRGLRAAHQASQEDARSIASDTRRHPLERALSGIQYGAGVVAEETMPVPGIGQAGAVLKALKGSIVANRVSAASPRATPAARPEAPAPVRSTPQGVRSSAEPTPFTRDPLRPPQPNTGARPAREFAQDTDPRDLGYNPSTTFSRLEPDVRNLIDRTAREGGGFTAQRRGVQAIGETKRLAEEIGADPEFIERAQRAAPGTAMNAEEIYATARSVKAAAERRAALQEQIVAAGGPEHASSVMKAELMLAAVEQASLQRAFAGARTEAGRSLRILREALSEAVTTRSPQAYDRALATVGGRANAEQFIRRLNDLWTREVPDSVKARDTYRFLQQVGESGNFDKVREFWINSILSRPITHEVNVISNFVFAVTQPPTRLVAATSEAVLSGFGKIRPREIYFSEVPAATLGSVRGVWLGLRKALHIARHGYDLGDVTKFVETGRMGRAQAIGGPIGTAINIPTRLLAVEDAVFKGIAYQSEISALAAREASKAGLRGANFARRVAELEAAPTPQMVEAASKQAKYATFQSEADKVTRSFMELRTNSKIGAFVIPFIQAPMNLVKRGVEYSPAGYLRAFPTTGAERSMAIARATIGSAVLTYFATKMLAGELTAGAPRNPAERDAFYRAGKVAYAIKIGDQWVEYQRLEPMMTPVKWMASAYEAFQNGQDTTDAVAKSVAAVTGSLKDSTYLSGLGDLIDAMDDPARFSERFLANVARGFVPYSSLVRGVAEAQDPYVRDPKDFGQRIAAGLPGASRSVPPKLDVYGEPMKRGPFDTGPGALVDPRRTGVAGDETARMIDAEIARVREHVPSLSFTGFVGSSAGGVKLDDPAQFRYQELAGTAQRDRLAELIASPQYQGAGWEEKAKQIDSTRAKARQRGASTLAFERRDPRDPLAPPAGTKTTPTSRDPLAPPAGAAPRSSTTRDPLAPPRGGRPSGLVPNLPPGEVQSIIATTAQRAGIDPRLALAVAQIESNFDPAAVGDTDTPNSSHGVFQERLNVGRGGFATPDPDPARQTERFAADVQKLLASGFRGTPGQIAAAVQRPFDAAGYARKVDAAYR